MKKIKIILLIALLVVLVAVGIQLQTKAPSKISGTKVESQNKAKTSTPAPQATRLVQSNYNYFPQPAQFADVARPENPDKEVLLAQIPPEVLASMPLPLDKKIRVASIKEVMNSFRRSIPQDISPEEREKAESEIEQMEIYALEASRQLRTRGYLDINPGEIKDFEEAKSGAKPMKEVAETIFNPSDTSNLEAQGLKFEGARALHQEGEKAISLTRVFGTANGGEVQITEGERQGVTLQKEMINQNINGQPAIYVTLKSPDGKELKKLLCFSEKKTFELKTNDTTVDLVTIARSIRD